MREPATKRVVVNEAAARFRLMRRLPQLDLMMVQRTQSPLGPVFTVNTLTGAIVHRNISSRAALAQELGLLKPNEVAE